MKIINKEVGLSCQNCAPCLIAINFDHKYKTNTTKMKRNILLLFFILFIIKGFAIDGVIYNYDAAGNRILRKIGPVLLRSATVDPTEKLDSVMVEAEMGDMDVSVYPNPTRGALYVEVSGGDPKKDISMKLFSPQGANLQNIKNATPKSYINMSAYPSGWYVLRVHAGDKDLEFKVIKQ
jgi:hypothetical protein